MYQLIHRGIIVPAAPAPLGLRIIINGVVILLTPHQEEMAMAWVRKLGTPYADDPVFQTNFLHDFLPSLQLTAPAAIGEIDFSALEKVVAEERHQKSRLTQEQRKALAAERKANREALKAEYGYAIVDGQRVELGNYMAEPSGLFMGRGQHPLRGRWKQGAAEEDITLNLSPDAPRPAGNWREIVWQPESLWVARWDDKLSGKTKYVWLADTTPAKQTREAAKFDKARRLQAEIDSVRAAIQQGLADPRPRTRMLATACYLIDALCLRVGDEKDPDEADTVGATTLRPEHIKFLANGKVEFHFLGKDSVEWKKKIVLPELVRANLEELVRDARPSSTATGVARDLPQLFPDIGSDHVNRYLSSILPGLTAKVFRTYRATSAVHDALEYSGVTESSPEYAKWQAVAEANLKAAELCNHTKKAGVNWSSAQRTYNERLEKAQNRQQAAKQAQEQAQAELQSLREQVQQAVGEPADEKTAKKLKRLKTKSEHTKTKVKNLAERVERASLAVGKIKSQMAIAKQKRTWNLGTSLKSYIDPRVFHSWGEQVDYDVIGRYYPTILQRKFAWVRLGGSNATRSTGQSILVRTCLHADVPQVAQLFWVAANQQPACILPSDPAEIAQQYLPALGKPWCEAVIAFGDKSDVTGFAVIGPEHEDGKIIHLDVFGLAKPGEATAATAEALAEELQLRFRTYQAHNPKKEYDLQPRTPDWPQCSPELAEALGFATEEDETDGISIEMVGEGD
ncbi:MAG: DNA topoisomerase I [Chloroflexi bacterium]|nr:DNA topoisomerase I [Chloroflexota bacterium]